MPIHVNYLEAYLALKKYCCHYILLYWTAYSTFVLGLSEWHFKFNDSRSEFLILLIKSAPSQISLFQFMVIPSFQSLKLKTWKSMPVRFLISYIQSIRTIFGCIPKHTPKPSDFSLCLLLPPGVRPHCLLAVIEHFYGSLRKALPFFFFLASPSIPPVAH